jgi:hypothetical protein
MKFGWKEVAHADLAAEQAWLETLACTGWGEPALHEVIWHRGH